MVVYLMTTASCGTREAPDGSVWLQAGPGRVPEGEEHLAIDTYVITADAQAG
jgi:hypothetical protein